MIKREFDRGRIVLYNGDCKEVIAGLDHNLVDSIVSDPPYGLSFMGKKWDYDVPSQEIWENALKVLKHGGHLLAFAGTRTQHRMAVRIEDAGFEIRDMVAWVYGCLSEDTEILTINGWEHYHKNIDNNPVLCYNLESNSFEFQKPTKKFLYENKHTAYRIQSDYTDQIVSRNHRVLVERDGKKIFAQAETLQRQENIPFLESLSYLPETIHNAHEGTGIKKQDLLTKVQECDIERQTAKANNSLDKNYLSGLWRNISNKKKQTFKILLSKLQWSSEMSRMEKASSQRESQLEARERTGFERKNDWKLKLGLEGGINLFQTKREICESIYKVCKMPQRVFGYVKERWLCNGTSLDNCKRNRASIDKDRMCSSYQPRCNGQQAREFDAIQNECRPQEIRTRTGYKTTLATITPIEYKGKVWCVEVPTGAFVARRNGKIFITGNSGFPKSLNIGKAVDKLQGNESEVVWDKIIGGIKRPPKALKSSSEYDDKRNNNYTSGKTIVADTKGTSKFEGWGTALKPAIEPITMARKPLEKGLNIAENCLKYGTGGINIDKSRVEFGDETDSRVGTVDKQTGAMGKAAFGEKTGKDVSISTYKEGGRFPANLITDGSEEVRECFPETNGGKARTGKKGGSGFGFFDDEKTKNTEGTWHGGSGNASRFFKSIIYQAKASKAERNKGCEGLEEKVRVRQGLAGEHKDTVSSNSHPTVKPIALMEYLIKMITPKGGIVLDPFMGSGSTGVAAIKTGNRFIGIELDEDYFNIACARIEEEIRQPNLF